MDCLAFLSKSHNPTAMLRPPRSFLILALKRHRQEAQHQLLLGTGSTTHPLPSPRAISCARAAAGTEAEQRGQQEPLGVSQAPGHHPLLTARKTTWSHQSSPGQLRTARALGSLQEEDTSSHNLASSLPLPNMFPLPSHYVSPSPVQA